MTPASKTPFTMFSLFVILAAIIALSALVFWTAGLGFALGSQANPQQQDYQNPSKPKLSEQRDQYQPALAENEYFEVIDLKAEYGFPNEGNAMSLRYIPEIHGTILKTRTSHFDGGRPEKKYRTVIFNHRGHVMLDIAGRGIAIEKDFALTPFQYGRFDRVRLLEWQDYEDITDSVQGFDDLRAIQKQSSAVVYFDTIDLPEESPERHNRQGVYLFQINQGWKRMVVPENLRNSLKLEYAYLRDVEVLNDQGNHNLGNG